MNIHLRKISYIDLFISLKAEPNQFKIAIPRSLTIDVNHFLNKSLYADFKYYLAAYNEAEIKSIVNSMQFAKKQGKSIKYRPHPRYSDISLLKKYVDDIDIEWPQQVNILESVSNLDYAVGSYTTVLLQAFFSGKSVLLDDITFQKQYVKLKDLRYILSNVGLPTLSNYQI